MYNVAYSYRSRPDMINIIDIYNMINNVINSIVQATNIHVHH